MDNLNLEFGEVFNVVQAITPVNFATGANQGDWVSFKNYQRLTVLVHMSIGTAGDDITVTARQATDVAGTGAKDAVIIDRVYRKEGATTLAAVGPWTLDEQTLSADWTNATNAENELQLCFDVLPEMLDMANGFDCFSILIADVGVGAQLGGAQYIMRGARGGSGIGLPSAIVD